MRKPRRTRRSASFHLDLARNDLEERVVPASASTALPTIPVLAQIRNQYIAQFQSGYAQLAQDYVVDVGSSLFSGGASAISTNRAAFDTLVGDAIGGLEYDLDSMLQLSPLASR